MNDIFFGEGKKSLVLGNKTLEVDRVFDERELQDIYIENKKNENEIFITVKLKFYCRRRLSSYIWFFYCSRWIVTFLGEGKKS